MESSDKTRQLIQRLLLWLCLLLVGYAVLSHTSSHMVQNLTNHKDSSLRIAVFTEPAMLFTYNPNTHQVMITVASGKCALQHKKNCFRGNFDRFFIPDHRTAQTDFWENFKSLLSSWRFNPTHTLKVLWIYLNALHNNHTDLTPAEFFLLVQDMTELNVNDFAVKYPPQEKRKKRSSKKGAQEDFPTEKLLSTQQDNKPLLVEILNASGKKGVAQALTQYLREQNNKGLLRVDVIDYGNFPTPQKTSAIIDYSGKLIQATQISRAIGLTCEIQTEISTTATSDTLIILGEDFRMPL